MSESCVLSLMNGLNGVEDCIVDVGRWYGVDCSGQECPALSVWDGTIWNESFRVGASLRCSAWTPLII